MTVVEALAEALSFENEDTECITDTSAADCWDSRCHDHGCMVARVNRWRAALSPDLMKASSSAEAIQTLDNLAPKPEADDLMERVASALNSIGRSHYDSRAYFVRIDEVKLVRDLRDRILALQAHIADLYIERDQAHAELASVRERTIEECCAVMDDDVVWTGKAIKNAIRALNSPTGET